MTLDDDHIVLAAEYVLGTLNADELARAELLTAAEPEFAALVRHWEDRLGALNAMVALVEPPAELFGKIQGRLAGAEIFNQVQARLGIDPAVPVRRPEVDAQVRAEMEAKLPPREHIAPQSSEPPLPERAPVIELRTRMQRWRGVGVAMTALAAGLAGFIVTAYQRPEWLPIQLRPQPMRVYQAQPATPNRFVAVLQKDAASPAFILTVDVASQNMTVRRVAADAQQGKSYELWLVSQRFPQPRSLGLVGTDEFSSAPKLAGYEPDTISDATYAVSLEPEGGSPTGAPTGPVLWAGKLIETAPARR